MTHEFVDPDIEDPAAALLPGSRLDDSCPPHCPVVTENRTLESALDERERELDEAQRIAKIGTWRWVLTTGSVSWSSELYRIFERDPALPPLLFTAHQSVYSQESWARLDAAFERTLQTGEPFEIDLEIRIPSGAVKSITARCEAELSADREVIQLRGSMQDITQRKRHEELLALSEARYRSLVRATTDIVVMGKLEGTSIGDISEFRAFTGLTAEQIAGAGWSEAIHPDDREKSLVLWKESIASGKIFEIEQRIRRFDGVYRHMLSRAVPVRDASGNAVEWISALTDITERKLAEQENKKLIDAAQQERDRLSALINSINDEVWFTDAEGRFTWANPAALKEFGIHSAAGIGVENLAGSLEVLRADGSPRPIPDAPPLRALRGKPIKDLEEIVRTPATGEMRFRQISSAPVRDAAGAILGSVSVVRDITERKRAEEQLRGAHQRLENVLKSITDGLAIFDRNWICTYFSEQGARVLGIPTGNLLNRCVWDTFPNARQSKFHERFSWAVSHGESVHFEEFYPEPLDIWIECHGYPSDEGFSVYFRDISDRKKAEAAIHETQSRFRKLFESDMLGIAIPDRFGAFYEGNDEFLRIVGYTREDLNAGKVRWDIMTPPEYAALDAAHIAEAAARGSCTPYEKEYIRKDGSRTPIQCGYALLEGSNDQYIGFIQDISKQKQAEAALRERERRFRILAENLPQFVWIRDANGKYMYCNQRLLDYLGQTEERVRAQVFDFVHPDDLKSVLATWQDCLKTGKFYENEYRLRRHDGAYRYVLTRAVPIRDEAGQIERWLGSSTDIHDQKLAEEALRRSEKLATAGRLAASMAHEINNPLASVMNAVYLALQDPALDAQTRTLLQAADQELTRVAQFTAQTLRFHKQSNAPEPVDLAEIMDSVLAMYAARLRSSSIRVERDYRTAQKLHCFKSELRQVFANLVGNSLDALGQQGRLLIRIQTARSWTEPSVPGIRVVVADTGNGIPVELRARLFEPFVSTKEITGVGLGLWVSQGIVQKHGGHIVLRSRVDAEHHGTVFSLFFPIQDPAA